MPIRFGLLLLAVSQLVLAVWQVADAGKAAGSTNGAFDAVSLGAGAVLLAALAWLTVREAPAR